MKLAWTLLLCALLGPWAALAAVDDTTYAGTLPCGSCAQRQATLTLFADHHFRLRLRDLDATGRVLAEQIDLGRWLYDGDGRRLLRGGREAPLRFELRPDGSLRGFDALGRPLPGPGLAPQATLDRIEGPLRLRGLYFYLADAASFQDCLSGGRWPVAIEGAHVVLERAYLAQGQGEGGRWVLATLDGRFELRDPEPGLPPRETLVVERFDRLWPGETCAADMPATAALLNTRWRLVAIDEQPVQVGAGGREPWLQLLPDANKLRGFGGCNAFQGHFAQGSDGLQILDLAATRLSCADSAQEARYLDALRATASRQIVGDALQLHDAQGRVRLRFEALYLR